MKHDLLPAATAYILIDNEHHAEKNITGAGSFQVTLMRHLSATKPSIAILSGQPLDLSTALNMAQSKTPLLLLDLRERPNLFSSEISRQQLITRSIECFDQWRLRLRQAEVGDGFDGFGYHQNNSMAFDGLMAGTLAYFHDALMGIGDPARVTAEIDDLPQLRLYEIIALERQRATQDLNSKSLLVPALTQHDVGKTITVSGDVLSVAGQPRIVHWLNPPQPDVSGVIRACADRVGGWVSWTTVVLSLRTHYW